MLAPLAREVHHPPQLVLSAEPGFLPCLSIGCLLRAALVLALLLLLHEHEPLLPLAMFSAVPWPPPWLAIGCLLRAPVMLAPVARERHHPLWLMLLAELALAPRHTIRGHLLAPRMPALLVLDVLNPLWGMLSAKLISPCLP